MLLGVLLVVWQRKVLFGVVASALLLVLGMGNYVLARHGAEWQWPPTEILCEARVVAEPRARQRSVLCEVEVMAVRDSSAWHRVERKVFAYLEPSAEAKALNPGDVLCFEGKVRVPHNFSDSLTFDYARYVTMQGAAGTVYVPRERWRRVEEQMPTLRERLLRLRLQLLQHYEAADFDEEVMGVLAALTLGDKRGLSMGVRSVYNDAGASHVLALSGLHVGIIYGVFALGLNGILRRRSLQWLRELLTLTVLWLFALLVGMSASVVRAVTMCTLYALARWVADENSSPLHVLALTALLMLLVRRSTSSMSDSNCRSRLWSLFCGWSPILSAFFVGSQIRLRGAEVLVKIYYVRYSDSSLGCCVCRSLPSWAPSPWCCITLALSLPISC